MASRFLFNQTFWEELAARVPEAKRVRAAVAYLGSGASNLLPLRQGDKLVVDMSLRAVRSGTTDPREVRKYLRRGVDVFSRPSLHAKFIVIDQAVIAGSANLSSHARQVLDEAALVTDDAAAVKRATATFEQLCTEPVRKPYLDKCIEEFRPPKFGTATKGGRRKQDRGKVWILGNLGYGELPEDEEDGADRLVRKTREKLLDFQQHHVEYCHYAAKPTFATKLREGDWIITAFRDGGRVDVYPPSRFLGLESRGRRGGKRRYFFLYETPKDPVSIGWSKFRQAAPAHIKAARRSRPRTTAITDDADADALLRLWDSGGHFRGRKR